MKKYGFKISVVSLTILLCFVLFYMVIVHVPYYNYYNQLDIIRNEICEENNYEYDNYFYKHNGKEVYYILRIKLNNKQYYVAFDENKKQVDSLEAPFASENDVKKAIKEKFNEDVDTLEVGYENNKFVYCTKIMNTKNLTYVYYNLSNGEFVKSYYIED